MARNVTLANLRAEIEFQADVVTSSTGRYPPTRIDRLINQSVAEFRERICSTEGMAHYLVATTGTISSGSTSPYSFKELDLSNASPSIVRVFGVDITVSNIVRTLHHVPFQSRNDFGGPNTTGIPRAWAIFNTRKIAIFPAPDQSYFYTVWYLPVLADLSADGDTFDGVAGWEAWIVWDVVCNLIARDQYPSAYALASTQREQKWANIIRGATKVTSAGGQFVGRDTLRGSIGGRRLDLANTAGAAGGLPPDGSVTNAMLANMPEERLKGRARAASAGVPQDLTPTEAAGVVAVFSGFAAGLVPTGVGNAGLFLSNAGSWLAPSVGGSVSGLQLSQLDNVFSPVVLGRIALGTGAVSALGPSQVATMLPYFASGTKGVVAGPTGADGTKFLRDDNTWNTPPGGAGGSATGASPSAMFFFPPLSVLGNSASASGVSEFLNRGQVASLLPLFGTASGSTRGLVYSPTAGVAGRFLRDDGTFQGVPSNVPTGLTINEFGPADPLSVLGRFGAATGAPSWLAPGAVASLLPNHFGGSGTTRGLVYSPTAGTQNRFLRDDGSWQGAPSSTPTAIALSQFAAIPESTILGRTSPSGIPEALTVSQVATMLPLFNTLHKGLTPAPGVVSGNFLKDDGTWASTAAGSATGISNSMVLPMPPFSIKGRNDIASGIPQDVLVPGVVSMLPNHFGGSGTTRGLVYSPTLGVGGKFLRDDGSWQGTPSSVPTAIALSQLAAIPESTILGRTSPSGIPEALTVSQVATMLPLFNDVHKGLVPGSGGGTTNFLRADGTFAAPPAGGGGSGMVPQLPTGAFQYAGSGFQAASGFMFTASGIHNEYGLNMPTGAIRFGFSGISTAGLNRFASNSTPIAYRSRDGDGNVIAMRAGANANDLWLGDTASGADLTMFAYRQITLAPFGGAEYIYNASGCNLTDNYLNATTLHKLMVGNVQKATLDADHLGLAAGVQYGTRQLAHIASTDKLGTWTPSGFANVATGIALGASGYQLSVGSGGPAIHGSGIDFRSSSITALKQLNGLDGINVGGFLHGGGAASGTQDVVAASGTIWVIPQTTTVGQVYAAVPTLAIHGDVLMLENRSGATHKLNNAGTGMGAPSQFMVDIVPSGGISIRFASGAWEYGNRYKLGGA